MVDKAPYAANKETLQDIVGEFAQAQDERLAKQNPEFAKALADRERHSIRGAKGFLWAGGISGALGASLPFLIGNKGWGKVIIAIPSAIGTAIAGTIAWGFFYMRTVSKDNAKLEEMSKSLLIKKAGDAAIEKGAALQSSAMPPVIEPPAKPFTATMTPPAPSHAAQVMQEPQTASLVPTH